MSSRLLHDYQRDTMLYEGIDENEMIYRAAGSYKGSPNTSKSNATGKYSSSANIEGKS